MEAANAVATPRIAGQCERPRKIAGPNPAASAAPANGASKMTIPQILSVSSIDIVLGLLSDAHSVAQPPCCIHPRIVDNDSVSNVPVRL